MPQRYSDVVESIFASWLESLKNPDDQGKVIDPNVVNGLKQLIDDGMINTAAQIRRFIDEVGGKNAA